MFVPFDQLPAGSRIWIYQMNRAASNSEREIINSKLTAFCEQWQAHEEPVRSSFTLFYNQFVVLAVDEQFNPVGGCSIDGSVRVIQELQHNLGINFINRTDVACWIADRVEVYSITQLKEDMSTGLVDSNTLMFNNLITTKKDLEENWKIPIKSSWLAKRLSGTRIASSDY